MPTSLRKRWLQLRNVAPDALRELAPGSAVMLSSTAGFANQVRAALAVAVHGHIPVVQSSEDYQARAAQEEGIALGDLFPGLTREAASHARARAYRDWVIPPWAALGPEEAAVTFNALNFQGLVNPGLLPHLPEVRAHLRALFDGLGPALDRRQVAAQVNADQVAVHLRMFGRNHGTNYYPPGRHMPAGRHLVKEAWSAPRIAAAIHTILAQTAPGDAVAIYTDRRDHEDAQAIIAGLRAADRHPGFATLAHDGAMGALEECLLLSGHKRMVLTTLSTFGHLAAILSEDLEAVCAV